MCVKNKWPKCLTKLRLKMKKKNWPESLMIKLSAHFSKTGANFFMCKNFNKKINEKFRK